MDFQQIRYFLALADTLNFTRAAEQCFVSQPALTQAIKKLEDELGGALIIRDGRNNRMTELGSSVRSYFEQIERTRRRVRAAAQQFSSKDLIDLNIGLMCTIGPRVLTRMLNQFRREHQQVRIILHDVAPKMIPHLIRSGALDGAFYAQHRVAPDDLSVVSLFQERMVVAFAEDHIFHQAEQVPLLDVTRQPYIDRLHCEFRDEFLDFCSEHDVVPNIVFSSEREDWIQNMVRSGMGVSSIPEYSLMHNEIAYRPISEPDLVRQVEFILADNTDAPPALSAFAQHAQDYEWRAHLAA